VSSQAEIEHFAKLKRMVRIITLLNAAAAAGLAPLGILKLHTFAYLSNVLAPVWEMPILDGKILKRKGGPFYPSLQNDLDRLVGMGVVTITGLGHIKDEDKRWRLEGSYKLNPTFAETIFDKIVSFDEERRLASFMQELAYALSALSDSELDSAMKEDATYSDPQISVGNVVDFDEWRKSNYSANAAIFFKKIIPGVGSATPGEMIHLYVSHLHRRINGDR
jgi:hypothetical protein